MNLFNKLVEQALENQPHLSPLKIVVEKELLHYDILRIMAAHKFLNNLTFIGGTCLRICYNGVRLSEDLDFTGGTEFNKKDLTLLNSILTKELLTKYGLSVHITDPIKESGNVDTWKIRIETRPQKKHIPTQRINIDICKVKSYQRQPMLLTNRYGIDTGTGGVILYAQSQEELFADKLLAIALRPNRIKYRDIWDIAWLHSNGIKPAFELIAPKLTERSRSTEYFLTLLNDRINLLSESATIPHDCHQELSRFLPAEQLTPIINNQLWWHSVTTLLKEIAHKITHTLNNKKA